jgi:hypothetical protein
LTLPASKERTPGKKVKDGSNDDLNWASLKEFVCLTMMMMTLPVEKVAVLMM